MKVFILVLCVLLLFLRYREYHIFKSRCMEHTSEFGFVLGSFFGAIIDGVCWYWIFRIIGL